MSTETAVERQAAPIRVVLVDDHHLIRAGLRTYLDADDHIEVVGEGGSVAEAMQVIREYRPDVLVTDLKLPDGNGSELTAKIRAEHPKMGILVLTMYAGDDHLLGALDAGASGFVGKDVPADEVVAAIRHAAANPGSFSARGLAAAVQRRGAAPAGPTVSKRELEVLQLLATPMTLKQIARKLFIAETTTKTHVQRIYEKLGAGNRASAVMIAVRLGLIEGTAKDEAG